MAGLAAALPAAAALHTLDVSNVCLGSDGAAALAAAVRQTTGSASCRLRRLILAANRGLDDASICLLVAAFRDGAAAAAAAAAGQAGAADGQAGGLELDLALTGVGAGALATLSQLQGLRLLSLFGCQQLGCGEPAGRRRWVAQMHGIVRCPLPHRR